MGRAPFILILAVWLQFLTQGLHNLCSFLGDRRVFVVMSWLWVGFWVRAGYQKDQVMTGAWNPRLLPPFSWERRRARNRVNDQLCLCDETTIKITKVWSLGNSRLVNTPLTRKVMSSISRGTETPVLWLFPDLELCISSSGCSSVPFFILFNKLGNMFLWVLWTALAN